MRLGRSHVVCRTPEDTPADPSAVAAHLARDAAISHVAMVHCETLIVDAMSSFRAVPIDARSMAFEAVVASANKCLEGTAAPS